MRNRNTNRWSMAALIAVLLAAWTGSAVAQGRGGPPPKDEGREPPSAADFIKRLDTDGDGKVSKDEFDGPANHFTDADKNADGYISEDEAPTGPPRPQGGRGGEDGKGERGSRR